MVVTTVPGQVELTVVTCCSCGITYAIPTMLNDRLMTKKEKGSTSCPNGHGWHYIGKSDEDRARDAEQRAREANARAQAAEQRLREIRDRPAGKKRDECPVCHRSFERLSTHRTRAGHWGSLKAVQ